MPFKTLLDEQFDVYFACAKYEESGSRTNDNVKNIKSFWLDIDCGTGKPYADQSEGLEALKGFCKTVGLPKPTVVNSGRGLHVYWPLTAPIARKEWVNVAKRSESFSVLSLGSRLTPAARLMPRPY